MYAGGVRKRHLEGRADVGLESTVVRTDAGDTLSGFTDCCTAAAKYALAVITVHMNRAVIDHRRSLVSIVIALILDAKLNSHGLELASSGADAGQAGAVVI